MKLNNEKHWDYAPDKWMLIKVGGTDPHYRVFGSWYGSYLDGDAWRLNSGVKSVEQDENYYYFYGHSGSVYRCMKGAYGANSYGYTNAQHICKDNNSFLMDEPEDVMKIDWENVDYDYSRATD